MNIAQDSLYPSIDGFQCTQVYRETLGRMNDSQLLSERGAINAAHARGDIRSRERHSRIDAIQQVMDSRENHIKGVCRRVTDKVYQIRQIGSEHRMERRA